MCKIKNNKLFKYQCDGCTDCFDNSDEISCAMSNRLGFTAVFSK